MDPGNDAGSGRHPCAGLLERAVVTTVVFALLVSSGLAEQDPSFPRTRCATTSLLAASGFAQAAIGLSSRPALPDFVDSAVRPVRVHFDQSTTTSTTASTILAAVEDAWTAQVDGAGFPAPLPDDLGFDDDGGDDRFDVYLAPVGPGIGALTVSGDDAFDDDGRAARASFLRIAPQSDEQALLVTVHHEFQHAVQFAIDALESTLWFESTAVAWELRARPDVTAWQEALPSFQRQPQAPLFTDGRAFAAFATDDGGLYEYGAALFALYIDAVVGADDGRLLRDLWQASVQPPASERPAAISMDGGDSLHDENEPDWLDALRDHVGGGDALASLVLDFAVFRALTGPLTVVGDGPPQSWNLDGRAALQARALRLDTVRGVWRTTTEQEGPFGMGCATFSGKAPRDEDIALRAEAVSIDGHRLGIAAVVVDGAFGSAERTARRSRSTTGPAVSLDVDVPADQAIVLAICDVADVDADDDPMFSPIRLRFARRDVEAAGEGEGEGDRDDEGEGDSDGTSDDDDVGWSCQSSPAPSGSPQSMRRTVGILGFLLAAGSLLSRGLRSWRRRRLYANAREQTTPRR